MTKTICKFKGRKFLNKPGFHTDASISWDLVVKLYGTKPHTEGVLRIRDCSQSVELQLDFYEPEWYRNSDHKLKTLIEELMLCREKLAAAHKKFVQIEKEED
jgi:hypothetical protein